MTLFVSLDQSAFVVFGISIGPSEIASYLFGTIENALKNVVMQKSR